MKSLKRPGSGFHSEWMTPDRAVAVLHRADDHAHRGEVVDLVELATLLGHLRVDRVEVLGAARDLRLDPELVELLGQVLARLVDVALALGALLGDQTLDLVVLARMQRLEREVLELPLDRVDTEPVGDRAVDVERLAGLLDLLLLGHRGDRAHVVQAIGELDQDDPDVRGHRDHHLAVVLGLRLVARLERQPGELGDAVDQAGDLLAERLANLLQRRRGVLDGVVQQRRAQRLGVEAHPGADLRHADRMDDEVLAGCAGAGRRGGRRRTRTPPRRGRGRPRRPPRGRAPRRSRTGRPAACRSTVGQLGALDRGLASSERSTRSTGRSQRRDQRGAPSARPPLAAPDWTLLAASRDCRGALASLSAALVGDLRCSGIVVRPRIAAA